MGKPKNTKSKQNEKSGALKRRERKVRARQSQAATCVSLFHYMKQQQQQPGVAATTPGVSAENTASLTTANSEPEEEEVGLF